MARARWESRPCKKCGFLTQREDFAKSGRTYRHLCKPCYSERVAAKRRLSPNKQCRCCKHIALRTAYKGIYCPRCRSLRAYREDGGSVGEDLTVLAEQMFCGGRTFHELTEAEKRMTLGWAEEEARRRGLWPADKKARERAA